MVLIFTGMISGDDGPTGMQFNDHLLRDDEFDRLFGTEPEKVESYQGEPIVWIRMKNKDLETRLNTIYLSRWAASPVATPA